MDFSDRGSIEKIIFLSIALTQQEMLFLLASLVMSVRVRGSYKGELPWVWGQSRLRRKTTKKEWTKERKEGSIENDRMRRDRKGSRGKQKQKVSKGGLWKYDREKGQGRNLGFNNSVQLNVKNKNNLVLKVP